jgi:hypothetical protein
VATAGRIEVSVADVQPVASFIARVLAADAMIAKMTAAEAAALPGTVAAGIADLQSAVRDLGLPAPAYVVGAAGGGGGG